MTVKLRVAPLVVLVVLVAGAAPAGAHGGPGGSDPPATNYRSGLLAVDPDVDGLEVRVIEAGSRIEVVNETDEELLVRGYEGEPYLRIGPEGVFENERSSAVYLNTERYAEVELPSDVDNDAEPRWRRVDTGNSARWHDHRAHWMGGQEPPAVAEDPGEEHVVIPEWVIPMELDGTEIDATGELRWVPPPSPWPWYGLVVLLVGGLLVAGWAGRWRGFLWAAAALLLGAVVVDLVGVGGLDVSTLVLPLVATLLLLAGLVLLDRRRRPALALLGAGATTLALAFGVASLDWLHRSQLPTDVSPTLARAAVAVAVGAGVGIAALSVLLLLRPDGRPAQRSRARSR